MARTAVTKQTAPGGYAGVLTALTWGALDSANGNDFDLTGREMLLIRNDDAGAQTVTLTSVDDELGRAEDITAASIPAGEYRMFGPIPVPGWLQSDRKFYVDCSSNNLFAAVVEIPSSTFR